MLEKTFKITDPIGMHARPATIVISTLKKYKADASLIAKGKTVNAKSLLNVLTLALKENDEVTVRIDGEDEIGAMQDLEDTAKSQDPPLFG